MPDHPYEKMEQLPAGSTCEDLLEGLECAAQKIEKAGSSEDHLLLDIIAPLYHIDILDHPEQVPALEKAIEPYSWCRCRCRLGPGIYRPQGSANGAELPGPSMTSCRCRSFRQRVPWSLPPHISKHRIRQHMPMLSPVRGGITPQISQEILNSGAWKRPA